jgi:uncharacterized membrane protein
VGGDAPAVEGSAPPVRESVDFARIVAFTDGVFAIAITLLVLNLEVPRDLSDDALNDYLADSWPQLFAYFLSFAVIGRFWITHHRAFGMLHDFDRRLLALNLVYLSLIVLIPFASEVLGEYGDVTAAVVLYAAVVGSAALLSSLVLRHTLGQGHVHADARASARAISAGLLRAGIVFYVSIPIAFVDPLAGQLTWLCLLVDALPGRLRGAGQTT